MSPALLSPARLRPAVVCLCLAATLAAAGCKKKSAGPATRAEAQDLIRTGCITRANSQTHTKPVTPEQIAAFCTCLATNSTTGLSDEEVKTLAVHGTSDLDDDKKEQVHNASLACRAKDNSAAQ